MCVSMRVRMCICICVYVCVLRVDALSVVTSLPARAGSRVVECRWVKAIDAPAAVIAIQTRAPRDAFVGQ
jgi:hypothetical protein